MTAEAGCTVAQSSVPLRYSQADCCRPAVPTRRRPVLALLLWEQTEVMVCQGGEALPAGCRKECQTSKDQLVTKGSPSGA